MEGISPAPGWGVERWSGAESIFGPGAEKGVCTKNTGAVTSLDLVWGKVLGHFVLARSVSPDA